MKPTSGETTGPVTLKRVRAAEFMGGDLPPGIPLNVEVEYGGGDGRFFGYRLAEHLREALGIRDFHHDVHSGDPHVIHVRVRRDEMEEVVLAIPAAIAGSTSPFRSCLPNTNAKSSTRRPSRPPNRLPSGSAGSISLTPSSR